MVRKELGMGAGKVAAQCSHASVEAVEKMKLKNPEWVEEWKASGQEKVVLKVQTKKELLELFQRMKQELPCALIKDAGRTQIEAGEATCFGCGPAPESELNKFTKNLKLL